MSILADASTRVVVQGITGHAGMFHARLMKEYGTKIVAGVTPGKGDTQFEGIPIFETLAEAVGRAEANASVIFVPAPFAADAIMEAADNGVKLIVCITEGIPALDVARARAFAISRGARLIGPNCPGVITPGQTKIGIMPAPIHIPGAVGVVSRSGTLTYEAIRQLTQLGIGQSTAVGIGGDPIIGTNFAEILELFHRDDETQAIVLIGEIGGTAEEEAAQFLKDAGQGAKPVVAFIAGRSAPPGKRMGHAGAITSGSSGTAEEKIEALRSAGVTVELNPARIGVAMQELLAGR
jgi:succinyl-CoA synthetase alpha subunit